MRHSLWQLVGPLPLDGIHAGETAYLDAVTQQPRGSNLYLDSGRQLLAEPPGRRFLYTSVLSDVHGGAGQEKSTEKKQALALALTPGVFMQTGQ